MSAVLVIETDRRAVESLMQFLIDLDGVSYLRSGDPLEGIDGYLVYRQIEEQEVSMHIVWRFAKPVRNIITIDLKNAESLLTKRMDEKWELLEHPKRMLMYLVKYADVDDEKESEAVAVSLTTLRCLSDDLQKRFLQYREYAKELKIKKEKARDEGCVIPRGESREMMRCNLAT